MTDKLRRMNAERQVPELTAWEAESRSSEFPKAVFSKKPVEEETFIPEIRPVGALHPDQGGRGDFLKVTVMMDPGDFEAINTEMVRRKRAEEKGAQLSGCIREAIRFWRAAGIPRQE